MRISAAAHLGAGPVIDVAVDFDRAAGHAGAEMRAGGAADGQPAAGHFRAEPFDAAAIAFDDDSASAASPVTEKKSPSTAAALPCWTGQTGDGVGGKAGEPVRGDARGLDGDGAGVGAAEGRAWHRSKADPFISPEQVCARCK